MTVPSATRPFESRSSRTRSSNSRGKVDKKMAKSGAANSKNVASRSFKAPPRSAVTCMGTRTATACGKKRANFSAQPCAFSGSVTPVDRFTSPLDLPAHKTLAAKRGNTQIAHRKTESRWEGCTCEAKAEQASRCVKLVKRRGLRIPQRLETAHVSHPDTRRLTVRRIARCDAPSLRQLGAGQCDAALASASSGTESGFIGML
jgi:hypothetical protein